MGCLVAVGDGQRALFKVASQISRWNTVKRGLVGTGRVGVFGCVRFEEFVDRFW
jgi:hypothetical protein